MPAEALLAVAPLMHREGSEGGRNAGNEKAPAGEGRGLGGRR